MNVVRLWKIYRTSQRLAGFFQEAQVSKHLFKSKSFWFNVLTGAAELSGVLPLSPRTAILVISAINVALRVLTKGPVHVLTDAAREP